MDTVVKANLLATAKVNADSLIEQAQIMLAQVMKDTGVDVSRTFPHLAAARQQLAKLKVEEEIELSDIDMYGTRGELA